MRKRFFWSPTAANQVWPSSSPDGGLSHLEPFNWVKIDNRGAHDVRMYLEAPGTGADDQMRYIASIPTVKVRILNVAGPNDDPLRGDAWPHDLYLVSIGGATTVMIEIADHEISDIDQAI